MKKNKISTVEGLKAQLEQTVIRLAKLAESFREVERIFFTRSQQPQYLQTLCLKLKAGKTDLPNPSQLLEEALHFIYKYDEKQNKWREENKVEKIDKQIFAGRCQNLLRLNQALLKENVDEVTGISQCILSNIGKTNPGGAYSKNYCIG